MAEEPEATEPQQDGKGMYESIMEVPGTKVIGLPPDKKKQNEQILKAYADSEQTRDPRIMKEFEDSMNHPPRSIGERIEGEGG